MFLRFCIILILSVAIMTMCNPVDVIAGETLISYQGRLTWPGGTPVVDGEHFVGFSLYADSTGSNVLWQESDTVLTTEGLFVHLLGSQTSLSSSIFIEHEQLYLEISIEGETIEPRTRLTSVPRSAVAEGLCVSDDTGLVVLKTVVDSGGSLQLLDFEGNPGITLQGGRVGDSAVIIPESAINSYEILDEPGIAGYQSSNLIDLSTGEMSDLVEVEITIPDDGYIVLIGKCYLLLSGTTGANSARIQIDETEGGVSQYPYYTQAGLGGYVNTNVNYFPAYVTRTYYKQAGEWTFRLEGRAMNSPPALAQSWDHILTAIYFSSSYGWVSYTTTDPTGFPSALPIRPGSVKVPERTGSCYEVDLRDLEEKK